MHQNELYVSELLERGVRVLIYAGTYDWIGNWVGNERWTMAMEWSGQEGFRAQELKEWTIDGERAAGKFRSYRNLTFATIYAAGHMVSQGVLNIGIKCPLRAPFRHLSTSLQNRWNWESNGYRLKTCNVHVLYICVETATWSLLLSDCSYEPNFVLLLTYKTARCETGQTYRARQGQFRILCIVSIISGGYCRILIGQHHRRRLLSIQNFWRTCSLDSSYNRCLLSPPHSLAMATKTTAKMKKATTKPPTATAKPASSLGKRKPESKKVEKKEKKRVVPAIAPADEDSNESEAEEEDRVMKKAKGKEKAAPKKVDEMSTKPKAAKKLETSKKSEAKDSKPEKTKSLKKEKKKKAPSPSPTVSENDEDEGGASDKEDKLDEDEKSADEEEVLLHGFSSESDSSDEDDDDGVDKAPIDVGKLPTVAKDDASVKRKLEWAKKQAVSENFK